MICVSSMDMTSPDFLSDDDVVDDDDDDVSVASRAMMMEYRWGRSRTVGITKMPFRYATADSMCPTDSSVLPWTASCGLRASCVTVHAEALFPESRVLLNTCNVALVLRRSSINLSHESSIQVSARLDAEQ